MSDYYILETAKDLATVRVVFHIPVSAANNAVGVSWQTALAASLGGADAITSVLADIAAEDLTALKNGSLFEKIETVRFTSLGLTNAQRLAEVETAYTAAKTVTLANFQITLNFYGKSGDVA